MQTANSCGAQLPTAVDAQVVCTSALHPNALQRLEEVATVRVASDASAGTLVREAADADIIIVRDPLPREIFSRAPRLRAAIRHGAGLDMIPVDEATAAGVLVANVPGANAQSVAEHVILVTLTLARRLHRIDADLRAQGWRSGRAHAALGRELGGRTLGLVGTGNVARAVQAIARNGFNMRVLGHTRSPERIPEGIEHRPLDQVLSGSDVVVLACPLTDATRGLINAERLALMKTDAVLVNVSRGAVIDDDALLAALGDRSIRGAALDVFVEQPLTAEHPYFDLDNVVLTPHVAGITDDSMERMGLAAVAAAADVLSGEIPRNLVNEEVLSRYRVHRGGGRGEPRRFGIGHE